MIKAVCSEMSLFPTWYFRITSDILHQFLLKTFEAPFLGKHSLAFSIRIFCLSRLLRIDLISYNARGSSRPFQPDFKSPRLITASCEANNFVDSNCSWLISATTVHTPLNIDSFLVSPPVTKLKSEKAKASSRFEGELRI